MQKRVGYKYQNAVRFSKILSRATFRIICPRSCISRSTPGNSSATNHRGCARRRPSPMQVSQATQKESKPPLPTPTREFPLPPQQCSRSTRRLDTPRRGLAADARSTGQKLPSTCTAVPPAHTRSITGQAPGPTQLDPGFSLHVSLLGPKRKWNFLTDGFRNRGHLAEPLQHCCRLCANTIRQPQRQTRCTARFGGQHHVWPCHGMGNTTTSVVVFSGQDGRATRTTKLSSTRKEGCWLLSGQTCPCRPIRPQRKGIVALLTIIVGAPELDTLPVCWGLERRDSRGASLPDKTPVDGILGRDARNIGVRAKMIIGCVACLCERKKAAEDGLRHTCEAAVVSTGEKKSKSGGTHALGQKRKHTKYKTETKQRTDGVLVAEHGRWKREMDGIVEGNTLVLHVHVQAYAVGVVEDRPTRLAAARPLPIISRAGTSMDDITPEDGHRVGRNKNQLRKNDSMLSAARLQVTHDLRTARPDAKPATIRSGCQSEKVHGRRDGVDRRPVVAGPRSCRGRTAPSTWCRPRRRWRGASCAGIATGSSTFGAEQSRRRRRRGGQQRLGTAITVLRQNRPVRSTALVAFR